MEVTTKDRILEFINSKGISKTTFLEQTNIKRGFLDKDKMKASVSDLFLAKILSIYPDVNLEWLITGEGEMTKNSTVPIYDIIDSNNSSLQRTVPLFSLSDITDSEHPMFNKGRRPDTITIPHMPACDAAVYIHGDSMYPIINTADIACFKRIHDLNDIYWGEMYIIEIFREEGNYITFKYIRRSTLGDNYVSLHSHNPDYAPQDVLKEKIIKLGLIKVCVRYNTLV